MLKGSVLVLKLNDMSSLHENTKNGHIRVFADCMKKAWIFSYTLSAQQRL